MESQLVLDGPASRDPDALDHAALGTDQDPLLGFGLREDDGFDPHQRLGSILVALDRLDLHLDGVRHLLPGATQHLLTDQLGQPNPLALIGVLLGLEVERALRQQAHQMVGQRTDS